jgi:hypothetical protein
LIVFEDGAVGVDTSTQVLMKSVCVQAARSYQ